MWSWLKRSFAPESTDDSGQNRLSVDQPVEQAVIKSTQPQDEPVTAKPKSQKTHIEFFLYDAKKEGSPIYTQDDLHRYPMMGFTLHFLADTPPEWVTWVLKGLEETLSSMKVSNHCLSERHMYSLFVDLKLYPQPEVKKSIYLVFHQFYQWYCSDPDQVSLRVHIGGEELYQQLLETHLEAV